MSLSAIDKIDALSMKSSPIKSNMSSFWDGYSGYIPRGDLARDDYGAAAAYAVVIEVFAALAVWQTNLDSVAWIVRDKHTGAEIARTNVQEYPTNERGAKWFRAIKQHERRYYQSLWKRLSLSDWLFGNSYVALLEAETQYRPNSTNYVGLKWLNPLNTNPMIMNGRIQYFQYSGMDSDVENTIAPQAMAYRINRADIFNDLLGYSGVLAAMDKINLGRNSITAFKNFFAQGMQLGGVISPVDQDVWSDRELEQARREWRENHKGAANAGKWAVIPKRANITPFGQEDASRNFTVSKELKNDIFLALNVPPQLAGDPSDAKYDNADDIKRQWFQTFFIPYVKDIAGFHSDVVLPKLEPDAGVYIEGDISPYQVDPPDVVSQDMSAGIISIADAQAKRGYPVSEKMQGIHVINGVPMHEDIIEALSRRIPSQYALDYAQAQAAGQTPNSNADTALGAAIPVLTSVTDTSIEVPATEDMQKSEITSPYLTREKAHTHSHDLPPIQTIVNVSELEELANWRKFLMNGKAAKRPFEQKALRGDIGDAIQFAVDSKDKQTILDAFKLAQDKIDNRIKAIQDTRLDFENDFDTLLSRARNEKMGRVQWASAMRAIIRRYGYKAYVDGMADAGVEDDPTEDDMIAINQLASDNSQYVTELGNVLYKSDTELSDAQADAKASQWFNKTVYNFYTTGLANGDSNAMYEWFRKHGKDSCRDCVGMEGQRHRLKWFMARKMPKSSDLECEGFECECGLVRIRGRSRDKLQ